MVSINGDSVRKMVQYRYQNAFLAAKIRDIYFHNSKQ